jgi:hypothetical protein
MARSEAMGTAGVVEHNQAAALHEPSEEVGEQLHREYILAPAVGAYGTGVTDFQHAHDAMTAKITLSLAPMPRPHMEGRRSTRRKGKA